MTNIERVIDHKEFLNYENIQSSAETEPSKQSNDSSSLSSEDVPLKKPKKDGKCIIDPIVKVFFNG